jgi:hypothetical protein
VAHGLGKNDKDVTGNPDLGLRQVAVREIPGFGRDSRPVDHPRRSLWSGMRTALPFAASLLAKAEIGVVARRSSGPCTPTLTSSAAMEWTPWTGSTRRLADGLQYMEPGDILAFTPSSTFYLQINVF